MVLYMHGNSHWKEPTFGTEFLLSLMSLVEPSAQLNSAQLNKDSQKYGTGSTQLNPLTVWLTVRGWSIVRLVPPN